MPDAIGGACVAGGTATEVGRADSTHVPVTAAAMITETPIAIAPLRPGS
jgi:hypothetical protein